jgi:hypothetical protein
MVLFGRFLGTTKLKEKNPTSAPTDEKRNSISHFSII